MPQQTRRGRAPTTQLAVLAAAIGLLMSSGCGVQENAPQDAQSNQPAAHPTPVQVDDAIAPTGPWTVATRTGNMLYIAGMRGIDPKTDKLVAGDKPRIRQAFTNTRHIARSQGAQLRDAVRLVVYVTDMDRYRPMVNEIQEELWPAGQYPPRTIVQVTDLNQHDIVEIEGTFAVPED